jgi:hypothetical protein
VFPANARGEARPPFLLSGFVEVALTFKPTSGAIHHVTGLPSFIPKKITLVREIAKVCRPHAEDNLSANGIHSNMNRG